MGRVVRELVRPVEQTRSETDLQTDIQILEVIAKVDRELRTSGAHNYPVYAGGVFKSALLSRGYKPERIVEAINHAQKLVAQSNANPA